MRTLQITIEVSEREAGSVIAGLVDYKSVKISAIGKEETLPAEHNRPKGGRGTTMAVVILGLFRKSPKVTLGQISEASAAAGFASTSKYSTLNIWAKKKYITRRGGMYALTPLGREKLINA